MKYNVENEIFHVVRNRMGGNGGMWESCHYTWHVILGMGPLSDMRWQTAQIVWRVVKNNQKTWDRKRYESILL